MRTNEEQLELFANLLEPTAELFADGEIAKRLQNGEKPVSVIKYAIKNHKAAVIELLAVLDGENPETYTVPNPAGLAMKLLGFLNSPEIQELFTLQAPMTAAGSSGSVTVNTEDGAV